MDLTTILNLRENNPYSTGFILELEVGNYFLERKPLTYIKHPRDRYYAVVEGDSLWGIADQAYGDSKYYWVIQDVNKIDFAAHIEPGQNLIIPDLKALMANQEV